MQVAALAKQKTLLDTLFLVHVAISVVVGACGILVPYTFEFFAVGAWRGRARGWRWQKKA
jgi:hypothetical protein